MAFDKHKNLISTSVVTPPTPASSGTSLVVSNGTVFPTVPFNVTIYPAGSTPTLANAEIVRVTNVLTNTLTITRAQELTNARSITTGDKVDLTVTVKTITDLEALAAATSTITSTGTVTALAIPTGSGPLCIFCNNSSAITIAGISAGLDGQRLTIVFTGNSVNTIQHQNGGASAANRIVTLTGYDMPAYGFSLTAVGLVYDATASRWRMETFSSGQQPGPFEVCGRLSLSNSIAVSVADITGASATTINLLPYNGNSIVLPDSNGNFIRLSGFSPISVNVPGTTNTMYDVFCHINAGLPVLDVLAWSSDTARATGLINTTGGVWVKATDISDRYLGTFRTTGVAGQCEDSYAKRYLWNAYNRLPRGMRVQEPANSWAYSTNTWRQMNANAANQLDFVIGLPEVLVEATVVGAASSNNVASQMWVGIGEDSTTTPDTNCLVGPGNGFNTAIPLGLQSLLKKYPAIGRHTWAALEKANTGTITWYGDNASDGTQAGIMGSLLG